ncbi:MAG: hypothetical protein AAFZ15_29365 [Bacteroidota bacterium]
MKKLTFLFLALMGLTLYSCGGCGGKVTADNEATYEDSKNSSNTKTNDEDNGSSTSSTQSNDEPANLEEAMKQAKDAIKNSGLQQADPVNFRELQKFMPEELSGMERTSKSGETAGALGMKMSTAESKYKDKEGNVIEIKMVDTGGFAMGLMGMAAWASAEVDREDENGYERTSSMDGMKVFEKCEKKRDWCELSAIAKNRYVITAECAKCGIDRLKKAIKSMGLDDLPATKTES